MTRVRINAPDWVGTLLSLLFCIVIGIAFCFEALCAPLFGGRDTDILSNLLPIVQYRQSILQEGSFPGYTTLWYGGRPQWQNPLWSFFYLPATLIWLAFGLEIGTDIVICGHVIFMLLAGWYLSSLFLKSDLLRCFAAVLITAPMATALKAGHIENVMAYPWILLGTRFLLDSSRRSFLRGCIGGACLGVTALAGANYYVLYAAILYGLLILVQPGRIRLAAGFGVGSLVGLPHVASVIHLVGAPRGLPAWSIATYSEPSMISVFNDLFLGSDARQRWGFLALIGIGTVPLILIGIRDLVCAVRLKGVRANGLALASLLAFAIFVLLASGLAYRGHHLLDTFRVPVRALPFAALSLLLFVLLSVRDWDSRRTPILSLMMLVSVIHVGIVLSGVRPVGTRWGLDNSGSQDLAAYLQDLGARSVWLQTPDGDMLIHIALNQHGISVPNAYYGDMGQQVRSTGEFCGFSFDHILLQTEQSPESVEFRSNVPAQPVVGPHEIDGEQLRFLRKFMIRDEAWSIYQVICPSQGDGLH
jgi:hypothetical protein